MQHGCNKVRLSGQWKQTQENVIPQKKLKTNFVGWLQFALHVWAKLYMAVYAKCRSFDYLVFDL